MEQNKANVIGKAQGAVARSKTTFTKDSTTFE